MSALKDQPFRLLHLPAEIREQIYSHLLSPSAFRKDLGDGYSCYEYNLSIFRVCKLVYTEALKVFRQLNVFVVIETPWREAEQHVAVEGNVPVICSNRHANSFRNYHLKVSINAPDVPRRDNESKCFVISVDDLALFCKMWFYSDLNYAGDLNRYLRLTLTMQNPFKQPYDDTVIPKELQKRLLLPFGDIKNLRDVVIEGQHYTSLETQVREQMEVPYDTPSKCLEDAKKLKEQGNEAFTKNGPKRAIEFYVQSFEKLHIICTGRRRSVWGDAWFDVNFTEGPYEGEHGQIVRLTLRVTLVANIIAAYLELRDYEEAEFWGMRTIRLLREQIGVNSDDDEDLEEATTLFPASAQMGKIYYRTGVAKKVLGKTTEARRLLKVAASYLPRDETVARELASVSPQIG